MFCQNCGKKLPTNASFCSECGNKIKKISVPKTFTEKLAINNPIPSFLKNFFISIKKFLIKNKKICLGSITFAITMLVFLGLFNSLYGFTKLSWNKEYKDIELKYIDSTTLNLGINFNNLKELNKIKYQTNCGKIKNKKLEINWDLSKTDGECEIVVSYKLQKINKTVKVANLIEKELLLDFSYDEMSDEDLDLDGLTNKEEKQYQTNAISSDSDLDGLDDYYEIFTSKTDPNKKDSDDDGISDYDEIKLGLDPTKKDSKNDGITDGNRKVVYNYSNDNVTLEISGQGNIASTIIDVKDNTKISSKEGLINKLYTFYTSGKMDKANVSINYTLDDLLKYNLNEDKLSLYYYNTTTSSYEKVNSNVDKETKTIKATLDHFSNYVIGDYEKVQENSNVQVLFILDNSWSMYSNEQFEEITKQEWDLTEDELDSSDIDGIRFNLTSSLTSRLIDKSYKVGLAEFRSDYGTYYKIGSNKEEITEKLENMHGNFITKTAGTNITNALNKGIAEFTSEANNKYIVILTDGMDETLSNNVKKIITKANEKNIKICSIGFGAGATNTSLASISNATGCKLYAKTNASGLEELFENLGAELTDNLVDVNHDAKDDGLIVIDSGFDVNKDGFYFENYGTDLSNNGHCYGMATFAQLYYSKNLPLKLSAMNVGDESSFSYDLTNTYFEKNNSLYGYKPKTNVLKYTLGYKAFDEEGPSDYRVVNGGKYVINDIYKKEIVDSNLYTILEKEIGSGTNIYDENNKRVEIYESPLLSLETLQNSDVVDNEDKQLLNAIYTLFIKQDRDVMYYSSTNFRYYLLKVFGSDVEYNGPGSFINILKTRLQNKEAPVITSTFSGGLFGGHAINAISLVQNIDNPNYYYIGVYDNNYPGEKRYVDMECKNNICVMRKNGYYDGDGIPLTITPSLEFDLSYLSE